MPDYQARILGIFADQSAPAEHKIDFLDRQFLSCIELSSAKKNEKSHEAAEKARLEGNALFSDKKFEEARAVYTKSVLRAPTGSQVLSLSLANRSACSMQLRCYRDAVADIQYAVAENYPRQKRFKLYTRLARCYLKLDEVSKARPAVAIARSLLGAVNNSGNGNEKVEDEANHNVDNQRELQELEKVLQLHAHDKKKKVDFKGDSGATATTEEMFDLNVEYSPDRGRYVTAARDFAAGEVVACEEASAAALYPDRANGTNCLVCLRRTGVPVPCPHCASAAFCTPDCRKRAEDTFHPVECRAQVDTIMAGFGCSQVARLALRMVSQVPLDKLWKMRKQFGSCDEAKSVSPDVDRSVSAYSLVSNNASRWPEDEFRRAMMATLLLKILKAGGYFGCSQGEDRAQELFVGKMLLRNLQVLQFNAHETYEVLRGSKSSLKPWKSVKIGLAVFPKCSQFNHSCHGSVARAFEAGGGRPKLVLRALRPIKGGEEVHENYGPSFYVQPRAERRRDLASRYWFTCQCVACKDDWPLLQDLDRSPKVLTADEDFIKGQAALDRGEMVEAARRFSCLVNQFHPRDNRPTEDQIRVEDKLRTSVTNMGSVTFTQTKKITAKK